jgi:hypothetical protein
VGATDLFGGDECRPSRDKAGCIGSCVQLQAAGAKKIVFGGACHRGPVILLSSRAVQDSPGKLSGPLDYTGLLCQGV